MVTAPSATPWANPDGSIWATFTLLEDQIKEVPGIGVPAESRAVAVNCWMPPFARVALAGSTMIDAIGLVGRGEPPPPPPPPQERVSERRKTGVSFKKRKSRTCIT